MVNLQNDNVPKKALGYIRISDKKQKDGESPATQQRKIQDYANSKNIKMIEWFYDEAKSGKNTDREELQNMLKMAGKLKGQIDYIIVYKMSRASRDIVSYVTNVISVIAPLKISLISATEHFDNTTPIGRYMQYQQVLIDQLDNENKREVVIDNMSGLAEQGYWLHHPPRGYSRLVIKNQGGKPRTSLQYNHESDKVRDVLLRWHKGDLTESQLTRYCTSIGFLGLNGKPITQDVLHKIIINPIYAGIICCKLTKFQRFEGKHKGLISTEVYEQNQLVLKMRNKDYLLGLKHRKTNELFPLRRFVRCKHCSKYMTAARPKNSPRYYCHRPSCANARPYSIMSSTLHGQFEQLLQAVSPTDGAVRLLKEILKRRIRQELGSVSQELKRIKDLLAANESYSEQILNKFITDRISEKEKLKAMKVADEERSALQGELLELEQRQSISELSIEQAFSLMADIGNKWRGATLELKQTYQSLVFPSGFIYDIKSSNFITPDISPLYRLEWVESGVREDKNFAMVTSRRIELRLPG